MGFGRKTQGLGGGFKAVERLPAEVEDGQAYYLERDQRAPYAESDLNLNYHTGTVATGPPQLFGFASAAGVAASPGLTTADGSLEGSAGGILHLINSSGFPHLGATPAASAEFGDSITLKIVQFGNSQVAVERVMPVFTRRDNRVDYTPETTDSNLLPNEARWGDGDDLVIRLQGASGKWLTPHGTIANIGDENPSGAIEYRKGYYVAKDGVYTLITVDVVDRLPDNPPDGQIAYLTEDQRSLYTESDFDLDFDGERVGGGADGFVDATLAAARWSIFTNTAGGTAPQLTAAGIHGLYSSGAVGDHMIVTNAVAAAFGASVTVRLNRADYVFSRNTQGVAGLAAAGLALFSANYSAAFNTAIQPASTIEITGASGQRVADNGRLGGLETENPDSAIVQKKGYYGSQDGAWEPF